MDGKTVVLVVSALLTCSGCASQQVWSNPNKTQQEHYQTFAKCEAMANSVGPSNDYWTRQSWSRIFDNCMYGEGFYKDGTR